MAQGRGKNLKPMIVRAQGAFLEPRVDCSELTLCGTGESHRHSTTISMLPDNVLLEIFHFYRKNYYNPPYYVPPVWKWHSLVHICQRWRQIVFASPLRLDLRIVCTGSTPVRKHLGIWPALPILINYDSYRYRGNASRKDEDNVIAALEHLDRVCHVRLSGTESELEKITTVMQQPFPVLKSLTIAASSGLVLPAEFLGGSAPCLQKIYLCDIRFPALLTLLLSTSDLTSLDLHNILTSIGYISPEAMVVGLAALLRLEYLSIRFQSATSRPDRIHPPPVTRTVLPALTAFHFQGASEYLEDLVARIDCPQVNGISIGYLNQLVDFQVAPSQLSKFFDRSLGPKLTRFRHAHVTFDSKEVTFELFCHCCASYPDPFATTVIFCEGIDWQVSHIAQVLRQFSARLSNVVHLKLEVQLEDDCQLAGTDDVEWLHLLHQFSTVQTLHVSRDLAGHVALALEGIAGEMMVAEVLPSLDLNYLEGQPASSVGKFLTVRQLSGRPVTVIGTKTEFDERRGSYICD
jgi:hypothetical protein